MTRKILYIIGSILVIFLVTYFTLSMQTKKRNQDVYNDQIELANQGDYVGFLKYQTYFHKNIASFTTESYQVNIYSIVISKDYQKAEIVVFLRPLTDVKKANEVTDESDQSRIVVQGDNLAFDSKDHDNYGDFPVTYGLNRYNFYYYTIPYETTNDYSIVLYDYDGLVILSESINAYYITNENTLKNEYIMGFTAQEVSEMLALDQSYLTSVYIVFSVSVGIMVVIGYFYFKKLNMNK